MSKRDLLMSKRDLLMSQRDLLMSKIDLLMSKRDLLISNMFTCSRLPMLVSTSALALITGSTLFFSTTSKKEKRKIPKRNNMLIRLHTTNP